MMIHDSTPKIAPSHGVGAADRGDSDAALICADCEYALRGLSLDGRCPECGLEVEESIRAAGLWTAPRLRAIRVVVVAIVTMLVTWTIMATAFLFPPVLWLRLLFIGALLLHAIATVVVGMLGVHAGSRHRRQHRRMILGSLGAAAALPIAVMVLTIARIVIPADMILVAVICACLIIRATMLWFGAMGLGAAATWLGARMPGAWRWLAWGVVAVTPMWVVSVVFSIGRLGGPLAGDGFAGVLLTIDALLLLAMSLLGASIVCRVNRRVPIAVIP